MENNILVKEEQALGTDQLLKLTALLYLNEALVAQEYETCQELIDTVKKVGVDQGDITAVITDYLNRATVLGENTAVTKKQGIYRLRFN